MAHYEDQYREVEREHKWREVEEKVKSILMGVSKDIQRIEATRFSSWLQEEYPPVCDQRAYRDPNYGHVRFYPSMAILSNDRDWSITIVDDAYCIASGFEKLSEEETTRLWERKPQ